MVRSTPTHPCSPEYRERKIKLQEPLAYPLIHRTENKGFLSRSFPTRCISSASWDLGEKGTVWGAPQCICVFVCVWGRSHPLSRSKTFPCCPGVSECSQRQNGKARMKFPRLQQRAWQEISQDKPPPSSSERRQISPDSRNCHTHEGFHA